MLPTSKGYFTPAASPVLRASIGEDTCAIFEVFDGGSWKITDLAVRVGASQILLLRSLRVTVVNDPRGLLPLPPRSATLVANIVTR